MGGRRIQERACKNPKCSKLFKPMKPERMFCSPQCGWTGMRHRHPPALCAEVIKLIEAGMSCRAAGEQVGISTNAAEGIKKRHMPKRPKIINTCVQCGEPFKGEQRRKYCSALCLWHAKQPAPRYCKQCDKPLLRHQQHCCSRECYALIVIEEHKDPAFDLELTKLWNDGLSTAEIGRRLNVSKNSVIGRVHRMDLPGRPSPIRPRHEAPGRCFVHDDRIMAGHDPLPPMHAISWGAIALCQP